MGSNDKKNKNTALVFAGEQKFLSFLEKHLFLIALVCITAFALIVRILLMDFVSSDAYFFLLPWYDTIKESGFAGLSQPVGNYNMLYQFFIALFTYLPMEALHAYKIFSIIFDFLLAGLAMWIIYKNTESHRKLKAVIIYAAVLMSPLVFFNSACWAQCDVIYTFFCIFSIYELYKEKYLPAFILFGVAITFKLQAVFILPFLLFYYFYKKKFSFLYFLTIPAVMIVLSLPAIVMGRSVAEVFTIYFGQTSTYQKMSMNFPSFWTVFQDAKMDENFAVFSKIAMLLTVSLLLILIVVWVKKKVKLSLVNVFSMAFLISYTCVLFLPSMHERYGFIYEILAIFLALWYYKTVPMLVLLYTTSFLTYGKYLFAFEINLSQLSFVNLIAYVAYMIYLNRQMFKDCEDSNEPDETPVLTKT